MKVPKEPSPQPAEEGPEDPFKFHDSQSKGSGPSGADCGVSADTAGGVGHGAV